MAAELALASSGMTSPFPCAIFWAYNICAGLGGLGSCFPAVSPSSFLGACSLRNFRLAGPAGAIWASFTDINWFGTATGRIGYAWDRVLVYGKGGFAWADETHSQTFKPGGGVTNVVSTVDNVHTGWTAGAGIEVALWDNWTGKVEYNYFDLGRENLVFNNTLAVARAIDNWDIEQRFHVVKAGVNYRWR
jgi:opacity protein-like surface antigen